MTSEQDHSEDKKAGRKGQSTNGVEQGSKSMFGIFDDPEIQENIQDDPVFQFVKHHQNNILVVLVVLVVGYLFFQWYEQNQLERRQQQAAQYAELREAVEAWREAKKELTGLGEDASEEDRNRAESNLEIVDRKIQGKVEALRNGGFPYNQVAIGYQALYYAESEQFDKLRGLLPTLESAQSEEGSMYAELTRFLIAKALFNLEDQRETAWGMLVGLTDTNSFVAVPAAISLSRLADSEVRKQQALEQIEALSVRQPAQVALLDPAKARLASGM